MRLLLTIPVRVDQADELLRTPLMIAASKGQPAAVDLLLQYKANVNVQDKKGWSALLHSIQQSNLSAVHAVLPSYTRQPNY